jgi:serine/threonine-protein kinase
MALASGTRVGSYEVFSPLGAGGMGEVYRARDTKLQRDVAIKVLPEHLAADHERLARFEREAQVLAALNHPHIAQIYGFEESGHIRALVLELVEGETLAERIARGPLPLDEALPIARQIISALEAAHELGIIHRDLKPANIKLTPAGAVKVLDFGLAKLADTAVAPGSTPSLSLSPTLVSPATMTGVGTLLGTAPYMAPEQARGRATDKRSDVWAFGCVLYEMLTGRRAFDGEDVTETLASILKGQPDWTALPADLPGSVRALLRRCLEKDRTARVGDIAAARFALEEHAALDGSSSRAGAETSAMQAAARRERIASHRRALAIAAAAALVAGALAATAVWWLTRPSPPRVSRFEIIAPAAQPFALPAGVNVVLSPDGSTLVYHAQAGSSPQLFMRRLGDIDAAPIAGTELGSNPFFSPDGARIGFTTPTQMKTVALEGGPASVVTDVGGEVQGASWVDDTIVFAQAGGGLFRVPATGGKPESIVKPDGSKQETDYRWPEVLPDANVVLYTAFATGGARQARIVARRLDSGETRVVVEGGNNPRYTKSGHLLYSVVPSTLMAAPFDASALALTGPAVPVLDGLAVVKATGATNVAIADDGTMVYARGAGAVFQSGVGFQWLTRDGQQAGAVGTTVDGPRYPRVSPDGRWLAVTIGQANQGQIWVLDLSGSLQPRQLTFKGHNVMAVWSPDGKHLAFTSDRDGQRNLFRIAADGSELEPTRLTTSRYEQSPSAWTPDGEWLLYEEIAASRNDLLRLSLKDNKSLPWLQTEFDEGTASISPDGQWVSYVADQSGRPEVWVRPYPGPGAPIRVSSDGGQEPIWSRSGNELFYQSGDALMSAEVVGRGTSLEFKAPRALFRGGFVPFDANVPRTYDVGKDGRFLMIREAPGVRPASLVVVLNWFEELRRRAPHP